MMTNLLSLLLIRLRVVTVSILRVLRYNSEGISDLVVLSYCDSLGP